MSRPPTTTTTTTNTTRPANTTTTTNTTRPANTTTTTPANTSNTTRPTNTTTAPSPKSAYIPSITQAQFEQRFGNRNQYLKPGNFLGYNASKPFVPPLSKTTTILSDYDKNFLLTSFGPSAISTFISMYIQGLFNGLSASGVFYGTPQAIGNQIYPRGLSKYYDLYSVNGFMTFFFDYLVAELISYISLAGLPLNSIILLLSGKSWDNILSIIYELPPFTLINFGAWWGVPLEGMMQLGW